ncbi:MAG: S41 family peptidase [Candidatus Omnitrophota bacterium]
MVRKIFLLFLLMCGMTGFAVVGQAQMAVTTNAVGTVDENRKSDKIKTPVDLYSQVELFGVALTRIMNDYVDEKKPKDVIYGALSGMLAALDPHSQFLSPEDYEELKSDTEGKFGGLGIEISIRDGLLTVITPIEDTPAWKAGVQAGDRIVKIEKDMTRDFTLDQAVKRLRGVPGSKIHITIMRESEFKIHEYDMVREVIHVKDIKDAHIVTDNIAYLRLVEFREDSTEQLLKELNKLKDAGATALILDLRNNPGGLLHVAIRISELFLPAGKVIVSTKGRDASQNMVSTSHNQKNQFVDWPIVIMINEGSASGSEILAGALKDNKRAVTLGTKSFGKGSVQSVMPLPDGSALRLTTSKYFTPSGACIHEIGITPDIVIERALPAEEGAEGSASDVAKGKVKQSQKNEKNVKKIFDSIAADAVNDPNEMEKQKRDAEMKQQMKNDNQVQAAINVIKGIRVYKKNLISGN